MSTATFAYPFDPTGTQASNKITSERQILSAPSHTRFFFIIPLAGPFFRTGHKLIHHPSGRVLQEGVDYALTHRFHDASLACGKPIYGSITFFDSQLQGVVELEYQTIGGPWTITPAKIAEILSNSLTNPRITLWEQIVDLPHEFPVVDHPWELTDLVGASKVVEKLGEIEDAIRDAAAGADDAHVNNFNNPHQVTKAQVGLSNVLNYPIADAVEATGGTAHDRYMTPLRTREAVMAMVGKAFATHAANTSNPHNTTKAQVGLGNVADYAPATSEQAVEGTASNLYMTPLTTAAVINHLMTNTIVPHLNNRNNPHNVTKAQVGLGQVANLPLASAADAIAGSSHEVYMTPLRTRELVDTLYGDALVNHINNRSNPHNVTKAQIGLGNVVNLPLATTQAAQAGQDDSGYMTPRLTYEAILALGGGGDGVDTAHRADQNNPHNVTAEQVGAYTKAEMDGLLSQKLGMTATAANSLRLGGLTMQEVVRAARARFDWPAVNPRVVNGETINDGVTWTALATFIPPGVVDPNNPVADIVFYFTGGDRRTANTTPIYLVKMNIFNQPRLEVEQLAGVVNDTQFGYVRDLSTQAITIYVKAAPQRNPMSVLVMSDPTGGVGVQQAPLDFEPAGIVYADSFVYTGGLPNVDARPGDALFGKNPHFETLDDFDAPVEFMSVVQASDSSAVYAARQLITSLRDEFHDFLPISAYADSFRNAAKADLLGWKWHQAQNALMHEPAGTTMVALIAPQAYTSYSFEVDLMSDAEPAMAIGVCLAFVRKNGKDYGLYALRTPGGLKLASAGGTLPGGDIYELFSVGYNLLQDDAIDLGSTSNGLNWGDGVAHADRGTAGPYDPVDNGWADAGPCRMRVTRNGNVIFVQTSQLGSVDLTNGVTVTINLNDRSELAVFKGPTSWGLVKYGQPRAMFRIINRPDAKLPYVALSKDADGNDTSMIYRHNGVEWLSQPLTLASPYAKPGRLFHSEINHHLYFARRDGTLRFIGLAPYVESDVTVLTQ